MRVALVVLALVTAPGAPSPATAGGRWSAELFAGSAWSLPSPLVVRRPGSDESRIRGRWDTHALVGAPYYAWRFGRHGARRGWEIELVHHKLHLANHHHQRHTAEACEPARTASSWRRRSAPRANRRASRRPTGAAASRRTS